MLQRFFLLAAVVCGLLFFGATAPAASPPDSSEDAAAQPAQQIYVIGYPIAGNGPVFRLLHVFPANTPPARVQAFIRRAMATGLYFQVIAVVASAPPP